jgi:hypothetical protein
MATKEQKAMAIKRLNEIGPLGTQYKARAKELINDPVLVDQDRFGICGMAASTHILLTYDPLRFVDLLCSIFNNEDFEGIPIGIKNPYSRTGELLQRRLEQYERKVDSREASGERLPDPKVKLDFIVCRSLGKLLKKLDAPLFTATKDFSKKFAPSLGLKPEQRDQVLKMGDLALTGEAVEFILREIVQVPSLESHNKAKVELLGGPAITHIVNQWFNDHAGREPLIVAAVNRGTYNDNDDAPFRWLVGGDPPRIAFPPRRRPEDQDYDHWVIITGKITTRATSAGNEYVIPVWTWGRHFTARLHKDFTKGHISWLICSSLDTAKTAMPLIVPRTSPDWIADGTTNICSRTGCNAKIGKGSRHHCRLCGKLFCNDCCPELDMVPGRQLTRTMGQKVGQKFSPIPGPVRVCSKCFREHAAFDWMRDNEATKCQVCHKTFGAVRWRHHCRYCGKLVCDDCSDKKRACPQMGYISPVRICKTCDTKGRWM